MTACINHYDESRFASWMSRISEELNQHTMLWTTDADVWSAYIDSFEVEDRQYHTCSACKDFLRKYGGLVTIDEFGGLHPVLWSADAPSEYEETVCAMSDAIGSARVTGVFYSSDKVWGKPVTGQYTHLCATPKASLIHSDRLRTPYQAMCEKRENYNNVMRTVGTFPSEAISTAITLMKEGEFGNVDRFVAPMEFLQRVQSVRRNKNLTWKLIGEAPDGFCHPRSGVVGFILDAIENESSLPAIKRKLGSILHPLAYRRPTASAGEGAIKRAEEVVEKLGLAPSFERRLATIDELPAVWTPSETKPSKVGGVFDALKKPNKYDKLKGQVSAKRVTYLEFINDVLPKATSVSINLTYGSNDLVFFTAPVNESSASLFKWSNPYAWYYIHNGVSASAVGVTSGTHDVIKAVRTPHAWSEDPHPAFEDFTALIIKTGTLATHCTNQLALFPSCLRNDLHEISRAVENLSNKTHIATTDNNAIGLSISKDKRATIVVDGVKYEVGG